MARSQETTVVLIVVALVVGLLLAGTTGLLFMSGGMMGGGMMGGGNGAFGAVGLVVFFFLLTMLLIIIFTLLRPSEPEQTVAAYVAPGLNQYAAPFQNASSIPAKAEGMTERDMRFQEAAIVRLLEDDERRLYTFIREKGGEILQKDIVASGSFSKAKVTRLLDKLESKDIIVRERHGMTNKVRLITMPPKTSGPA